jgi:hypothetical protein
LNITRTLSLYLVFSVIAAMLIIFFLAITPSNPPPISFQEKIEISSLFIICCFVGIFFTVKPNWIRRYRSKFTNEERNVHSEATQSFRGHHPDCSTFQNHTIQWNNRTWCAGCFGLFIGLSMSILLTILYIATDFHPTQIITLFLFLLGLLIIPIVYGEIIYRSKHTIVHVFLNSLLPLSFFIITVAVGEITGKFIYACLTILLCFLWLDTRIQLSKWRHGFLCSNCIESCKMFTTLIYV